MHQSNKTKFKYSLSNICLNEKSYIFLIRIFNFTLLTLFLFRLVCSCLPVPPVSLELLPLLPLHISQDVLVVPVSFPPRVHLRNKILLTG